MTLNAKDAVYEGLKDLRSKGIRFFTLDRLKQSMPECIIGRAWITACLNELGCSYDRKMAAWVDQRAIDADKGYAPYRDKGDNQSLKIQLVEAHQEIEFLKASLTKLTIDYKELEKENSKLGIRNHQLQGELLEQEDMIRDLQNFIKKFIEGLGQPDSTLLFIFGRLQAILTKTPDGPSTNYSKVRIDKNRLEEAQDKVGEIMTAIANDDYCSGCKKRFFCKHYNLSEDVPANWLGVLPICQAHQDLIGDVAELNRILNEE